MRRTTSILVRVLTIALAVGSAKHVVAQEPSAPLVEQYLISGELANGDAALARRLKESPGDDQARFGLGVLRFVRSVERLAQSLYHYGLRDQGRNIPVPILRLPLPENPKPARLSYADSRKVLQTFIDDLNQAETTLVDVKGADVKLPLHFGRIKLDLDGSDDADDRETLWRLYSRMNRAAAMSQQNAEQFVITFDKADVSWLRGYCHLLSALCEAALAHDGQELFERTAHLFFFEVESPYPFLQNGRRVFNMGDADIADYIALIHLINLPISESKRMQAALGHLETVIALSRRSWQDLLAETDNDHEWIPNPQQTGVIPGVQINQPMTAGWKEFLAEAELILQGKKLIPFWRGADQRGINLRKVFTEPRTFDLVLWVQGTAAAPYLEAGPLSTPEVWQRFNRLFNGEFVGFALWFN